MKELFGNYSVSDIIIFIVIIMLAIKEVVSIVEWVRNKLKKIYDKDYHDIEEKEEIKKDIRDLNKFYREKEKIDATFEKINDTFDRVNSKIAMLIESDKEDIKAYITEKHHYFVYEQKWIDDYSLECIEKRFAIYEKEHGNSFVKGLLGEIRELPKCPPRDLESKYIETAEYVKRSNG